MNLTNTVIDVPETTRNQTKQPQCLLDQSAVYTNLKRGLIKSIDCRNKCNT